MICKICSSQFDSLRSLHAHFKKHDIHPPEYYCKYYPRNSLYFGRPVPYKNHEEYFQTYFLDDNELKQWETYGLPQQIKSVSLDLLKYRIESKNYSFAPCSVELKVRRLPSISCYKKHFGSYAKACKEIGATPLFDQNLPSNFNEVNLSSYGMIVDTREQDPLPFSKMVTEKIYVGDYMLNDTSRYSATFLDRKSIGDFLGTLSSGYERFEKEIQKAELLNGYLFVVVEGTIEECVRHQKRNTRQANIQYIFHNMNSLMNKYARRLQFVFSGSRKKSLDLIPRILYFGEDLWRVDLQYFLDKGQI